MFRRAGALGVIAIATAYLGVVACRQIAGITEDPPQALASTVCGLPYGTGACASCVNTNCCAESTACAANSVCAGYEGCLGKCNGDPACRSQCTIDDPPGTVTSVSALSACLAANCETACGLSCGDMAAYITPPDASAPCETCFRSSCEQTRACASSVDCDAYARCFVACSAPDCREACATEHAAGAALFAPVQQLYENACSVACAYGKNWNCVGHVVWPIAQATSITETGTVFDFETGAGVAGLNVCVSQFCATCGSAGLLYQTALTDADGGYAITTPPSPGGAFEGFECTVISSPNVVTQWAYHGFPRTQAIWNVSGPDAIQTNTPTEYLMDFAEIGLRMDPSRADIGVRVEDCLGAPARDVQVSMSTSAQDLNTTRYYYEAVDPTDAGSATTSQAIVFFLNVLAPDAGAIQVALTATPLGLGRPSSFETLLVQAGVFAQQTLPPTPMP